MPDETLTRPQDPAVTRSAADSTSTTAPGESSASSHVPHASERYALGDEIARGGMGVVYRATDTVLKREVAVKVLQERFGPRSGTARRFADEARITGQLQHPAIPPVHDLGTLPDGRPFLAMKLIKGQTLDDLLKANPDRGRFVAAFEAVCQGVAYVHAHGVVHRDLKPANVMVGNFGEVQVMDWGLAKVLGERSRVSGPSDDPDETAATAIRPSRDSDNQFTQAGSVLGTPAYMPPEQAIGAIDQIDARSDVFGLGGILAAILTGRPPFQGETAESTRQMAAKGKVGDCFERLDTCGADPELVALCKRCLAPEKDDRPADAGVVAKAVAALRTAADERARQAELDKVRAEGEKVAADLKVAEGRKRRRVWLGLAASLAIGLVAAVGLAVWADASRRSARSAERDADDRRAEAETARQTAEDETKLANAVKDFLRFDVLQLADPTIQQQDGKLDYDAEVKLRDVVLRASKAIDGKFADRPLVEAELRWTLGQTLWSMGRADLAVGHNERLRAIYAEHRGPDHPSTLGSMMFLANSYEDLGRFTEALQLREETLAKQKAKLGPDHPNTLMTMNNLANSYRTSGRYPEALNLYEETLALRKAKLGPDHPNTLWSMDNLANMYSDLKRHTEAEKLSTETLALMKAKLGPDHPGTLASMNTLANSYSHQGRHPEALRLYLDTLALRKAKLGPDHPDTLRSMSNLAFSYTALGRHPEALKLHDETLPKMKLKLGPDHPGTLASMNQVAYSYAALGRHPEALKLYEETLALQKAKLGPDHPDTVWSAWTVAWSLIELKRPDEALPRIDEVLKLADRATAAGKTLDPRLKPLTIALRLKIYHDRKDAEGVRRTAEMYETLGQATAEYLFDAACHRGVLAGLLKDKPMEANVEADKAMAWLHKSVAAGWRNRAHTDADTDLDALRGRDDFKALVGSLPYTAPPPRPAKRPGN